MNASEGSWVLVVTKIASGAFFTEVTILLASNIIIITIIISAKALRKHVNYIFVALLAANDALVCTIHGYHQCVALFIMGTRPSDEMEGFYPGSCQILGALGFALVFASVTGQGVIAFNRLVAVILPVRYKIWFGLSRALVIWTVFTWILPFFCCFMLAATRTAGVFSYVSDSGFCIIDAADPVFKNTMDTLFMYIPLTMSIISYLVIYLKIMLAKTVSDRKKLRKRAKGSLMMFVCCITFVISSIPAPIFYSQVHNERLSPEVVRYIGYAIMALFFLTLGNNFVFYVAFNKSFRAELKSFVRQLPSPMAVKTTAGLVASRSMDPECQIISL